MIKIWALKINIKVNQRSRWGNCETLKLSSFSKRRRGTNVEEYFKFFKPINYVKSRNIVTVSGGMIVIKMSWKSPWWQGWSIIAAFYTWDWWAFWWLPCSFFKLNKLKWWRRKDNDRKVSFNWRIRINGQKVDYKWNTSWGWNACCLIKVYWRRKFALMKWGLKSVVHFKH